MMHDEFLGRLFDALAGDIVSTNKSELKCYSYDAYFDRAMPEVLVRARHTSHVRTTLKLCAEFSVPFVVRGAGTGYAGGSVPLEGGVLICLAEMTDLIIDPVSRTAWAQAGVTTGEIMRQADAVGLRYPPDPSSYNACTIGGNVATNAGGAHCLGYGVTSNYVLECEVVLPDGQTVYFGGKSSLSQNLDIRGILLGSEGTLGVITAVRLRLVPKPDKITTIFGRFATPQQAISAMVTSFERAIIPEAYDLMTGIIESGSKSYKYDGDTIAFIDVEGLDYDVDERVASLISIIEQYGGQAEAMTRGRLMEKRMLMTIERWRKIVTNTSALRYFLFDAVVPRSKVRAALDVIARLAASRNLTITSTFHAGDGNLHPCPFFDPTDGISESNRIAFWKDVFGRIHDLDGILSGEHGIGSEKQDLMHKYFFQRNLDLINIVKNVFDPSGVANPGKKITRRRSIKNAHRSWERPNSGRFVDRSADGYIQVSGDVTRSEIRLALSKSVYELAFEPIGWGDDASVETMVQLGRPGLDEDAAGPCRDKFLGGAFISKSQRRTVIGSPFAKDVTSYDIRRCAYGGGDIFGRIQYAWLAVRPRRKRYVGRLRVRPDTISEGIDVREFVSWAGAQTSIYLRRLCVNDWELNVTVPGSNMELPPIIDVIQTRHHGAWFWELTTATCAVSNHTSAWLFRELPCNLPVRALSDTDTFPVECIISPFGGFVACPAEEAVHDILELSRPGESAFAERLILGLKEALE